MDQKQKLKKAQKGTLADGESDDLVLGGSFVRVQRMASSDTDAVLLFVFEDGAIGTAGDCYELTEADPDSGWIPASDETGTVKASGGGVDYQVWLTDRATS